MVVSLKVKLNRCIKLAILQAFFATGCATLDAKVAVPVSCLKSEPPPVPQTATEEEILAMSEYASTITVWTERLELKAFALKAEALLIACKQ